MKRGHIDLGAGDILRFVGRQLTVLEEDLRRIEGAIVIAAEASSSDRRIIQNLDRSLQVLQDLSKLCAGVSGTVESQRIDPRQASAHMRLGHLKAQFVEPETSLADHENEPDFFD